MILPGASPFPTLTPRFSGTHQVALDFLRGCWGPQQTDEARQELMDQPMASAKAIFAKHHQDIEALPDACRLTLGSGNHPIKERYVSYSGDIHHFDRHVKTLTVSLPLPDNLECDPGNTTEKLITRTYFAPETGFNPAWLEETVGLAKRFVETLQSFQGLSRIVPGFRVPMENLCKPVSVISNPAEAGILNFMADLRQHLLDTRDRWNSLPQEAHVSFPIESLTSTDPETRNQTVFHFTTEDGEQGAVALNSSPIDTAGWGTKTTPQTLHEFLAETYDGVQAYLKVYAPESHTPQADPKEL